MSSDMSRLLNELSITMETISPEVNPVKTKIRIEELLSNYNIDRKSFGDVEKDIDEKIEFYISSITLEGFSELTIYDYQLELRLFSIYNNKPVVQITTPDIRSYLASYKNIKASTTGKKLFALRSFFSWLVKEEYILRDPTAKINPPKIPHRVPKGLSAEELEHVRESCTTLRMRAIIETLYSTGNRISELSSLNRQDINRQTMSMHVIGKGNKEREVYLSAKAMYHLDRYLNSRNDECEAMFVTERKPTRRMVNATIQREIRKLEEIAMIGQRFTAHSFRRTLCNNMLDQGADLADVSHILGHASTQTTLKSYGTISEERKRQAHRRFHVQ